MYPSQKASIAPRHRKDIPFPSTVNDLKAAQQAFVDDMPEYAELCARTREAVRKDPRWQTDRREVGDDITVTTLGTGSASPSKHRNVACIHLDIPGLGGILMEAGEGSLGQLRRRFGPEGVRQVYENLRMIFISHMHADHHLGLQGILEHRFKVCRHHI